MTAEIAPHCPLVAAICREIPGGAIVSYNRQAWCSEGMQGWQIVITLEIDAADIKANTRRFLDNIENFEFDLAGMFVADINAEMLRPKAEHLFRTEIAALLLEG